MYRSIPSRWMLRNRGYVDTWEEELSFVSSQRILQRGTSESKTSSSEEVKTKKKPRGDACGIETLGSNIGPLTKVLNNFPNLNLNSSNPWSWSSSTGGNLERRCCSEGNENSCPAVSLCKTSEGGRNTSAPSPPWAVATTSTLMVGFRGTNAR